MPEICRRFQAAGSNFAKRELATRSLSPPPAPDALGVSTDRCGDFTYLEPRDGKQRSRF